MNILVLSRQKAKNATFHEWLGPSISSAKLFTDSMRVNEFCGFEEVKGFDNYEDNGLIEHEVLRLHRKWPINRIVATSESDILRAGRLRSFLNLQGQDGESAKAFRDKVEMKKRLGKGTKNFLVPTFMEIAERFDVIAFVQKHGFPAIIKPVDGSGSTGVVIVRNDSDLDSWLTKPFVRGLEIEKFITGDQYHIDGLIVDKNMVFCWPSKYLRDCLSFSTGGFTASHMLDPSDPLFSRLNFVAKEILDLLPTPQSTTFHLEIFHTSQDEFYFCEIASRTGGGMINPMYEHCFGINLTKLFVQAQAGIKIDVEAIRQRANSPRCLMGWGLVPPRSAEFSGFKNEVPPHSWVVKFNWTLELGTISKGSQSSVDQVANFIVEIGNSANADLRLTELLKWSNENAMWIEPP